jgi:hypothetical protein
MCDKDAFQFNPMTVPTLSTLVHEINAYDADIKKEENGGGGGGNNDDATTTSQLAVVPDVHKTSLGPYLKEFHQSFLSPMHSRLKRSRRDLADREAAQNVDF